MSSGPTFLLPSYYEILQLPKRRSTLSKEDVKAAYHRALLLHHPDKTAKDAPLTAATQKDAHPPSYTIDQIVAAYETLSDPPRRRAYDETLAARRHALPSAVATGTHPGVEALDLDELRFSEATNTWRHGCRCGDDEGYVLGEDELERESRHGEIYVGCKGCSLFVRVVFGVVDEEDSVQTGPTGNGM